ncbi:hypothetical protein ACFZBU_06565 [Embleya sp. NPDC008237]|uniref:hypothetical protein n=1 Tax=Embleya sp. NPDC008237 TaxID=3363978 RepID=UPI0036EEB623
MPGTQLVVAEGEDQDRAEVVDASGQKGEGVQGRVVGPVHVLDDQHRRARL